MGDGGGGHWLVRMEWSPAGWPVFLPLLIFPCPIKSRSSLLAPAHPGGPRKRARKWLCCGATLKITMSKWQHCKFDDFLWSPCVKRQTIIFLSCDFYLSSFFLFFPCLISAAVDWISTILPHMMWP